MFRQEVLDHRRNRLMGEVVIAIPPSWQLIGLLFFVLTVAVVIFLAAASYSRFETVQGVIIPDRGVAAIIPSRAGVVAEIYVREGALVEPGDRLLEIRADEGGPNDLSSAARIAAAVSEQDVRLAAQMDALGTSLDAQLGQITVQMRGLDSEIDQIDAQIELQRGLMESARQSLEGAQQVAERGFLSRSDLRAREDVLMDRQQGLSQLIQARNSKIAQRTEIDRSVAQIRSQNASQQAALAAARSEVAQQAANVDGSRSYSISAPIAGRVTAIVAKLGSAIDSRASVMTVVPVGAKMQADLMVPPSAIGFIRPGQEVRLAIDSFPYQKFGTISGSISSVAKSPVSITSTEGILSAYPVTVNLPRETIFAFGRDEPLLPGMTLSARIMIQRQSLLEWLFEPLFAVRRR